jgi:hypothetical protein
VLPARVMVVFLAAVLLARAARAGQACGSRRVARRGHGRPMI